ncbi:MAG: carboxypeptidase-like regulatory domain-containing protein, partial [Pedobacter sp.]
MIDTLTVQQKLIEVGDVYVPQSIQFSIAGKLFGFKFSGYVMGVYKNYNVKPTFNKSFFSNEILKIERSSNKKDPFYWEKNRSVPLTSEERDNYKRKDSVTTLKNSQNYLDSVDQVKNRFNPGQILVTPYVHYRSYNRKSVTYDPVATSVFFNTIEGLALKYAVNWRQGFEDGRYYTIKPEVRYGFANERFNANIKSRYLFDASRNGS